MSIRCLHCTADTSGALLCNRCIKTTRQGLANIATYHADLLSLGSTKVRIPRRPSETSDPVGRRALYVPTVETEAPDNVAAQTKTALVRWVLRLNHDPADTVIGLTNHLDHQMRTIANRDWAGEFVRSTLALERLLRRVVARGKGRWYAGICSAVITPERVHDGMTCACACHNGLDYPCDITGGCGSQDVVLEAELCDRDLYATPGDSNVRCPQCRTSHPVAQRRSILLAEARDTELPLRTVAHVCVTLLDDEPSVQRFIERLNNWIQRGTLVWSGNDGGTRLYRVGDILDLMARHAADPRGWKKRKTAC